MHVFVCVCVWVGGGGGGAGVQQKGRQACKGGFSLLSSCLGLDRRESFAKPLARNRSFKLILILHFTSPCLQ